MSACIVLGFVKTRDLSVFHEGLYRVAVVCFSKFGVKSVARFGQEFCPGIVTGSCLLFLVLLHHHCIMVLIFPPGSEQTNHGLNGKCCEIKSRLLYSRKGTLKILVPLKSNFSTHAHYFQNITTHTTLFPSILTCFHPR